MTRIYIEGTSAQQQFFDRVTGEIPIVVHNGGDGFTPDMLVADPFEDDTPIESACDLENPASCESCQ